MTIEDHTRQLIDLILDSFSEKHNVAVGIFEKNSDGIFSNKARNYFAPLCNYMNNIAELNEFCSADHKRRGNTESQLPQMNHCICGLKNVSIPIIVQNECRGTILCGQKILEENAAESYDIFLKFLSNNERITKKYKDKLIAKYNQVERVKVDYFEKLLADLQQSTSKLIFIVYFERKFIEVEKKDMENRINQVAHEIQIYSQGALSASEKLCADIPASSLDGECLSIVSTLPGMLVHLGSVVTNLLWLSTDMHYKFTTTDLLQLLKASISYYQWYANERYIAINLDVENCSPKVMCSSLLMEQVFNNLIHNAIKYSFKGIKTIQKFRSVNISVYCEGHDYFCVDFANFGIGILREEYNKIYEKFERGSKVIDERRTGTGIGLSIVKEIIDKHQGHIDVRSLPQEGQAYLNIFTIRLPYSTVY